MNSHVVASFSSEQAARRAADDLYAAGVQPDAISLMMGGGTRDRFFGGRRDQPRVATMRETTGRNRVEPEDTKADEGAVAGGALGMVAGGLAAVASLAIPGGILVAGPLWAALGGAAAGAAGGSLLGALIGSGIPEHHARDYEKRLRDGEALLAVDCRNEEQANVARRILGEAGPSTEPTITDRNVVAAR